MSTIGEFYDSMAPGQGVYVRAYGQMWEITRPEVPPVDEGCTTYRRPVWKGYKTYRACDDMEERIYERMRDRGDSE